MAHITTYSEKKLNPDIRGTWYSNYDGNNFPSLTLAPWHIAGIVWYLDSIGWSGTKAKGLTHLYGGGGGSTKDEYAWTELANIFGSRSDTIEYGMDYSVVPPVPKIYAIPNDAEAYAAGYAVAGNYTRFSVFTDEFCDGGSVIPPNAYYKVMRQFYRGFMDRLGNPIPANHNVFGGYMGWQNSITPGKFNMNIGGYESAPLDPYFVNGLKSQAGARKKIVHNYQTGAKDTSQDFDFFAYGLQNSLNLPTMCYNGMNEPDESHVALSYMNEMQRKMMAGIEKTIAFMSTWSESVTLPTDTPGRMSPWVLERPDSGEGDYFALKDHHVTPTWTISFVSFMSHVVANGWMLWDGDRYAMSKDAKVLTRNAFLESFDATEKRYSWKSPAGRPMPNRPVETTAPKHPFRPTSVQDIAIDNLTMVQIMEEFRAAGAHPMHLDYTTTYRDKPGTAMVTENVGAVSGTLGKHVITRHKRNNYGQITVLQLADKKKGLCIGAEIGDRWWIYYFNGYRSPLQFTEEEGAERIIATLPSGRTVDLKLRNGRTSHFLYR
ncbi:hypothetical protein GVN20_05720 [Runella sp. CRIBMP]|uniref:hypothetical protein n=1 Tax=Runella sp. CRIBMP TaxID=2683261 RepID=UPI00141222BA|nr:hypothetical protein [Runella sp. CRIBMP]NBB18848.1 hypothetical protein [Runella sp. CRIBMP]